jgi:hypothetical protein
LRSTARLSDSSASSKCPWLSSSLKRKSKVGELSRGLEHGESQLGSQHPGLQEKGRALDNPLELLEVGLQVAGARIHAPPDLQVLGVIQAAGNSGCGRRPFILHTWGPDGFRMAPGQDEGDRHGDHQRPQRSGENQNPAPRAAHRACRRGGGPWGGRGGALERERRKHLGRHLAHAVVVGSGQLLGRQLALDPFQLSRHSARALRPAGAVLGEEPLDERDEIFRKIRAHLRERRRLIVEHLLQGRERVFGAECRPAGEHLVQERSKGEEVRPGVELAASRLLGRHGVAGADESVLLGQHLAVPGDEAGQPEVENLGVAGEGDDDVLGLEVAVDQSGFVGGGETLGDLAPQEGIPDDRRRFAAA